ncbi:ABC transporter permease [Aureimonas altamirensis]|uniref:ABC transporter permease n=1 Tax=Aureimonas altamirensis TaxID=370622 RepID=UPI003B97B5C7
MSALAGNEAAGAVRPPARPAGNLRLALRFALREMRGGLSGFIIFLACLTLGVASIAAVNSVSRMMTEAIEREGRIILGGDIRFSLPQRQANEEERAYLEATGAVGESAQLRSMARLADGSDQTISEVKAVDGAYPLYGAVKTDTDASLAELLADRDGIAGAVAAPELFTRLDVAPGARIRVGSQEFELRARLVTEPDQLSDGFVFAPRLMIGLDALQRTGLVQPGSLVEYDYKVRLPEDLNAAQVTEQAEAQFPEAGWSIRPYDRAAPALQRNIERFSQFLTLVGLTALIVGGVGIANAVNAYLDSKRTVIATFKSLGGGGNFVVSIYLIQVMALASIGVGLGLALGAIAPFVAAGFLEAAIPVETRPEVYPVALLVAAAFGYMTALAFALLPLGRTRDVGAAALFRDSGAGGGLRMHWPFLVGAVGLALLVSAIALFMADDRRIAGVFLASTAVAFVILRVVALAIQWLARAAPRVRSTALRLAIGNIHRPGALTSSVVLSLGLGLTLLVTLATIDNNLRNEISTNLAERAPNFFFFDIQSADADRFGDAVLALAPGSELESVPMLRGRIVELNGTNVRDMVVPAEGAWVLRGDRGLTYSTQMPPASTLTEGEWWPADHAGENLVSFAAEEAGQLGLTIGDTVTVNVLGRNVTARIANLRRVEWQSLSINFVMVFSPNTFAGAPHTALATLRMGEDTPAAEQAVLRGLGDDFPAVTAVRVRDALDAVNQIIAQLALAIRAAAAVALVASIFVLAGALAAGNRGRVHDAVVLKTLGATRATLIRAYVTEYLLLGVGTAVFAIGAGALASSFVVSTIMQLPYRFDWGVGLATLLVSLLLTIGLGLAGTWRVLGRKAAPVLRTL